MGSENRMIISTITLANMSSDLSGRIVVCVC